VAVGVNADLLQFLVPHFEEDVNCDLFAFKYLAQMLETETGKERDDG